MYLAFIDLHLAWRLHLINIGRKPQLVFYPFFQFVVMNNFNRTTWRLSTGWGNAQRNYFLDNPVRRSRFKTTPEAGKPQITAKDPRQAD
jgi:hypothetical protein